MIHLIEPIKIAVIDNVAYNISEVNEKLFGGFCECGGKMLQKFWLNMEELRVLFSECEKCWKNHAYFFNSTKFLRKEEVRLIEKGEILDFLKNYLTDLEIEALVNKAQNKLYKPQDLARAKKKLLDMNFPFEDLVSLLK
ncbi:MAG: hypothetical protein PWQ58_1598 [Archaeoglobaceae archaeon]|nr:hypothetical protein [Archaeoglobaceae archaeon]